MFAGGRVASASILLTVFLGSFVANVIALSFYPLLGDLTFEQVNPMAS